VGREDVAADITMLETLHAELMERWRAHLAHPSSSVRVFVDDGPTSFSEYERSPIRVVFVLKEPNINVATSTERWRLTSVARERGSTWSMLAYWAYGLLAQSALAWAEIETATGTRREQGLKPVAVVNLHRAQGQRERIRRGCATWRLQPEH